MLKALVTDPYEPLEHSTLWVLSFKIALLLALTSVKIVCELTALLVNLCYLLLCGDHSGATLRPHPSFIPKNLRRSFRLRVDHAEHREAKLHRLFEIFALTCYVNTTLERPCPRHALLGGCVRKCIPQSYRWTERDPPSVARAHTTCGVS